MHVWNRYCLRALAWIVVTTTIEVIVGDMVAVLYSQHPFLLFGSQDLVQINRHPYAAIRFTTSLGIILHSHPLHHCNLGAMAELAFETKVYPASFVSCLIIQKLVFRPPLIQKLVFRLTRGKKYIQSIFVRSAHFCRVVFFVFRRGTKQKAVFERALEKRYR